MKPLPLALFIVVLTVSGCAHDGGSGREVHRDDFKDGLVRWVAEQQPGGAITAIGGKLTIDDRAGCTLWFRHRLQAPCVIRYDVKMSAQSRMSDMNCFWMATDPDNPDNMFAAGHGRTGKFETYDRLRTYYVGYGGNSNTTTRFRRYDGTGARPLAKEHDLSEPRFLLQPDHVYRIELVVSREGRVQFIRDGELVFDFVDPEPLLAGWFGFRTVHSRMEISNFRVLTGRASP